MKKYALFLLVFLLTGCSYNLKTSVIEDGAFDVDTEEMREVPLPDCGESQYCRWEALQNIDSYQDYADYLVYEENFEDEMWNLYLMRKIDYAAVTPEECDALEGNSMLQNLCNYAIRFNKGESVNCQQEGDYRSLCIDQRILSYPSPATCRQLQSPLDQKRCYYAVALAENRHNFCDSIEDESWQSNCHSVIANSLYFCEDQRCVDHYFNRNMTRSPRLTYCNFDDDVLQEYCEGRIRDWFALSQQNFFYCSSRECYALLIDKYVYHNPEASVDMVGDTACQHLSRPSSQDNCKNFASETLSRLRNDIALCRSTLCLDSFRGNLQVTEEMYCDAFVKEQVDSTDLFSQEAELASKCISVVSDNKAVALQDELLCTTGGCLEEVRAALEDLRDSLLPSDIDTENCHKIRGSVCARVEFPADPDQEAIYSTIDQACDALDHHTEIVSYGTCESYLTGESDTSEAMKLLEMELTDETSAEEVKDALKKVDMNEVVEQVDLNETVSNIDLNALRETIDPEGNFEGEDLNDVMKNVDLNEEIKNIDVEALLNQIDIEELMKMSSKKQ